MSDFATPRSTGVSVRRAWRLPTERLPVATSGYNLASRSYTAPVACAWTHSSTISTIPSCFVHVEGPVQAQHGVLQDVAGEHGGKDDVDRLLTAQAQPRSDRERHAPQRADTEVRYRTRQIGIVPRDTRTLADPASFVG